MRRYLNKIKRSIGLRLGLLIRRMEDEIDRESLPKFANNPRNLHFQSPRRIANPDRIWIGDDVSLGPGCLLSASRGYPGAFMQGAPAVEPQKFDSEIRIGNRVSATGYLTIGAASKVEIDDDCLLASHIFISDNQHGFSNVDIPFKYQHLERIRPVRIGKGCWIGEHVVIMSGVTIGDMSIIGANSIVTRSVPERSIAFGNPARVIRRWDDDSGDWAPSDDAAN
jgi:acetyltransferase-like isoleucine patch superfamily enzyme